MTDLVQTLTGGGGSGGSGGGGGGGGGLSMPLATASAVLPLQHFAGDSVAHGPLAALEAVYPALATPAQTAGEQPPPVRPPPGGRYSSSFAPGYALSGGATSLRVLRWDEMCDSEVLTLRGLRGEPVLTLNAAQSQLGLCFGR
eukprot:SAG22_NODE_3750_length_1546_cov_1.650311_2_plen_143_part_00